MKVPFSLLPWPSRCSPWLPTLGSIASALWFFTSVIAQQGPLRKVKASQEVRGRHSFFSRCCTSLISTHPSPVSTEESASRLPPYRPDARSARSGYNRGCIKLHLGSPGRR